MGRLFIAAREKLRRVRDTYYRAKYLLTSRLAGRGGAHPELSQKGLLLIQFDALPYETFCSAMERGYLPFLRRQLLRKRFTLKKWYVGIPSNTPSVQAAVMYGNNDDIPGFRWYEKDAKLHVNFKSPLSAGLIESRLERFEGLLDGGSSYSNMFSGKASTSVATLGSFTTMTLGKRLRGFRIFALVLVNLFTVVRTIFLTFWEFFLELYDWLHAVRHQVIQRGEYLFPLYRILMNVWVREIVTVGAAVDIARGTPSVYVSYLAYDELAHQRGPFSKSAMNSLLTIDRRIKRLVQLARRKILREYDVFIFSDHGLAASMPFFFLYRQTLPQLVTELVNGKPGEAVREHYCEAQVTYARILALKLATYEDGLMRGVRSIVKAFRSVLVRAGLESAIAKEEEGHQQSDGLVVAVSGPLGHIYLPAAGALQDGDIQSRYAALLPGLVSHNGIGVVMTRLDGGAMIRSKQGSAVVNHAGQIVRCEGDPLPGIEPKDLAYRGLLRVMKMKNAGDVVVLGADHGGYIVNFEEQMAGHGGVGGLQNSAFLMHQPAYSWIRDIDDPLKLHEIFKSIKAQNTADEHTEPVRV